MTYRCLEVQGRHLWGNGWTDPSPTDRGSRPSPQSRLVFDYSGTSMVPVICSDDVYSINSNGFDDLSVFVDGELLTTISPTSALVLKVGSAITLPTGLKRVTIVNPSWGNGLSAWLRTLYLEGSAAFSLVPEPRGRRLLVIGDSIAAGAGATVATANGMWALVQRRFPGLIVHDTRGSADLVGGTYQIGYALTGSAVTDNATRRASVRHWARLGATEVWTMYGQNGIGNSISSSDWGIGLTAHLLDLARLFPGCPIYCCSPLQAANVYGATVTSVCASVNTTLVAAGGVSCVIPVDGTALDPAHNLADGVHPNDKGHGIASESICTVLGC